MCSSVKTGSCAKISDYLPSVCDGLVSLSRSSVKVSVKIVSDTAFLDSFIAEK